MSVKNLSKNAENHSHVRLFYAESTMQLLIDLFRLFVGEGVRVLYSPNSRT